MVQTCSKCSRANPAEAVYCFFDGFALEGASRRGGPVAVGAKAFHSPFVFPTGRTCRSFDELALACQEDWSGACSLLREGYLESFFGGLGRVDLVVAAKEASRFPDPERGLDQLLAKLPTSVLEDPRLRVEPSDVNLGRLESGKERSFELELENQGMRLVYGTVSSSDVWLTLGDAPGSNEKHFHFTHDSRIKVNVWPDRVRAGSKQIEAKLLVESNTGPVTVKVRCEKAVKPFPGSGPLAGCKTPRQVAEKAQSSPKDVAPLFEAGEVERWYACNGWVYPVTVPAASGIAAIQQFFEALGVTKAPKVEINLRELTLEGDVGSTIPFTVEVSTQEKRPVFAHVTSNVPWLQVGKAKFQGRTATIHVSVPAVPDFPGQTLSGELDVVSNGKQRFRVPVNLAVASHPSAAFDFDSPVAPRAAPAGPPPVSSAVPPPVPPAMPPVPAAVNFASAFEVGEEAEVVQTAEATAALAVGPAVAVAEAVAVGKLEALPQESAAVAAVPGVADEDLAFSTGADEPRRKSRKAAAEPEPAERHPARRKSSHLATQPLTRRKQASSSGSLLRHLVPALLLLACVTAVVVYDYAFPLALEHGGNEPKPARSVIAGPAYDPARLADNKPRVGVSFNPDSRFGVVMLDAKDPEDIGRAKKLTAFEDGSSNNTIIRIGTSEYTFGYPTPNNRWVEQKKPLPEPYKGWTSTMDFTSDQIRVTQYVQIVPGADDVLDTVLVYYWAANYGTIPHKVAIRLMLDTYIGKNDGVPFTVPGKSGFVTRTATYEKSEIPDYFEVVENPDDEKNPGTIARLGLRGLEWGEVHLLEPEKVLISRFPGGNAKWDWEPMPMDKDSCVAVYWPEVELAPKKRMNVAITYGLGKLEISDQLALSAPAAVQPGRGFIVTAYVYNATKGQKITLDLPQGMRVDSSTPLQQTIEEAGRRTQIFWKVLPGREGKYQIGATSEKNRAKPINVAVQARSIFG